MEKEVGIMTLVVQTGDKRSPPSLLEIQAWGLQPRIPPQPAFVLSAPNPSVHHRQLGTWSDRPLSPSKLLWVSSKFQVMPVQALKGLL